MHGPMFWDIVGPIALIAFAANLLWSVYSLRKRSSLSLFVGIVITVGISQIFLWSIGYYMLIVAALQLIAALYTLKGKNKFVS